MLRLSDTSKRCKHSSTPQTAHAGSLDAEATPYVPRIRTAWAPHPRLGRMPLPCTRYALWKKKCQVASTSACTMAEAKIDPVFRQVQP
jgi:hypothetical protein